MAWLCLITEVKDLSSEKQRIYNSLVKLEIEDKLAIITIDSPPVNALNEAVMHNLEMVLEQIAGLPELRVAILTGAGEKAFVAGADIKQFLDLTELGGQELVSKGQRIFDKIGQLTIPVICAINGFALGGGCELALACDIRVAEVNANFGLPEVGLGIIPGYGGTQRLARLIGSGKAKELIFTGELILAEEAFRLGMVEKLVSEGETALEGAKVLAHKIMSKGPVAVTKAKKAIDMGVESSLCEGLNLEAKLFGELCTTEDKNEGALAFLEKRTPNFLGR